MKLIALSIVAQRELIGEASVLRPLEDILSGQQAPYFPRPGRSAWLRLDQPLQFRGLNSCMAVKSLKIKGLGLSKSDGSFGPPLSTPFYRDNPHVGFKPDGTFVLVESAAAPLGGITLERARNEFDIAGKLFDGSCPTIAPIRLYRLNEPLVTFKTEEEDEMPLGVLVMGLPVDTPLRVDSIHNCELGAPEFAGTYESKLIDGASFCDPSNPVLSAISEIARGFGKTLRKFHGLGYYRYSGTQDNYIYSPESKEVVLVDLDSSRELAECSPLLKSLQIMRDVASGIFNLAANLMNPAVINRYPVHSLRSTRPFLAFASGYYSDVSALLLDRLIAAFESYYWPVHERVFEHRLEIAGGTTEAERLNIFKRYWMHRTETYGLLMVLLWHAHQASSWGRTIPCLWSFTEVCRRAREFSSVEICALIPDYIQTLADRTNQ